MRATPVTRRPPPQRTGSPTHTRRPAARQRRRRAPTGSPATREESQAAWLRRRAGLGASLLASGLVLLAVATLLVIACLAAATLLRT
ncbi:MAG: hypothetical protein IPM29_16790 [Planctomycetes bacterium]|nr:hypothetical protein [Planctomycetota bacterium]